MLLDAITRKHVKEFIQELHGKELKPATIRNHKAYLSTQGELLDEDHWRKRVHVKILEKAGLRHVRIHGLRHTYITLRLSKGDNILDVSKQVGHSSVKMTLNVYAHWIPGGKSQRSMDLNQGRPRQGMAFRALRQLMGSQNFFAPICTPGAPRGQNAQNGDVVKAA